MNTSPLPMSSSHTVSLFPRVVVVLALAPLVLLIACGDWTTVPEGFVKVEEAPFHFKAVAPDGSVIAVRYRENEEKGDLAFWTEVFEIEMVKAKGYRLTDKKTVTSSDGVEGTLMIFEFAEGQTPYHYGLALFVTDKSIVTFETATELEKLERYQAAFDEARGDLKVKFKE